VGLLENREHTLGPAVSRLGARERMSIAASLSLARKSIPSPPKPLSKAHCRLMTMSATPVPPDFLSFVDRMIDGMFGWGWDRGYEKAVEMTVINASSCREATANDGGARALAGRHESEFRAMAAGMGPFPGRHEVTFLEVHDGSKMRGVTKASWRHHVLKPLHQILYDLISRQNWCLRGEARAKRFKSFRQVRGEVYVSGDYQSATDNLSLEVSERILERVLRNCGYVPLWVRDYALRSLRAVIRYPRLGGKVAVQRRGQLMGNYLSFPLLCLTNYLVFRYLVPRPGVPVKINGDDIVFRARKGEAATWASRAASFGLVINPTKTMIDGRFFSLNSSFFEAGGGGIRETPVVRTSMLKSTAAMPVSCGQSFVRFRRGWKEPARRLLGAWYLASKKSAICAAGRAVVEDLGIPANNAEIHSGGLVCWERFFRGKLPIDRVRPEPFIPLPVYKASPVIKGWRYAPSPIPKWEAAIFAADYMKDCRRATWAPLSEVGFEGTWYQGPDQPTCEREWWAHARLTGKTAAYARWRSLVKRVWRWVPRESPLRTARPPREKMRVVPDWLPFSSPLRKGVGWG